MKGSRGDFTSVVWVCAVCRAAHNRRGLRAVSNRVGCLVLTRKAVSMPVERAAQFNELSRFGQDYETRR